MPAIGSQLAIHPRTAEPMATFGNASHLLDQPAFISRTTRLVALRRHAVVKLYRAPVCDVPHPLRGDVARGLEVSLRGFLQYGVIQSLVSHQFLQLSILFLKSLQLLGHFRSHAAVLLTPAVISLLDNPQHLANLGNLPALTEFHVSTAQHRNDLINIVTFLRHLKNPDRASPGLDSLTYAGTVHGGKVTTTLTPELHHLDACCRNVRSVFCRVLLVEVETKQVASHTDKLDLDFTGPGDVPVPEVKVNQHCGSGIRFRFQHTAVVDGNR